MANLITARIDVTKIDKAKLFKGTKGTYLDIVLMPNRKQSNFGDHRDKQTHMVVQSISKEEREAGKKGNILGNATELEGDRDRRAPAALSENAPAAHVTSTATALPAPSDDDNLPF